MGSKTEVQVVGNTPEEVGSEQEGAVDGMVDYTEDGMADDEVDCGVVGGVEVDSSRHLEVVGDEAVGTAAEHIAPDGLDRCLVFRCLSVPLVGKDSIERMLLKLLARTQVPT